MAIELKVPAMGESVASVQIGAWLKSPGDLVAADEAIVMIESDKAAMELPAPAAGVLGPILKASGEEATIGEVIGTIEAATGAAAVTNPPAAAAPAASTGRSQEADSTAMPSARRLLREHALDAQAVTPSGPKGRILREDVVRHVEESHRRPTTATRPIPILQDPEEEQVVPMTPLRRAIATRLLEAQRSMALLTTFNEVDMTEVKVLRATHQEAFSKKHGVKLGFMSFFVRASVEALKEFPAVNAEIRGTDIVYKNHYDLGIAVGGGKGLVVPVLRHAESLSFAEVEKGIAALAERAAASRLSLEELQGGTFTISNGGVYGSLLSTPIVNPPQSAILGLHAIQDRVVARDGQPVVRPMMYLALTYDHRIIDGKEAVSFLRAIKDKVESPTRILLEI